MAGPIGNLPVPLRPRSRVRRASTAVFVGLAMIVGFALLPVGGAAKTITGTQGPDTLTGTPRADLILGIGGDDTIRGRRGPDKLDGGAGYDAIRGGRGKDRLLAGDDGAVLVGGRGRDQFNMKDGEQVGGEGDDLIKARDNGLDEVNCGPGEDTAIVDRAEDGLYDCEHVVTPTSGDKR